MAIGFDHELFHPPTDLINLTAEYISFGFSVYQPIRARPLVSSGEFSGRYLTLLHASENKTWFLWAAGGSGIFFPFEGHKVQR